MSNRKERFVIGNPQFRVDSEGEGLSLRGYAAVFEQDTDLGPFTESIQRGAFRDSIQRRDDVAALIDHDPSLIVARTPDTLELSEDEHGLKVRISPAKTTIASDLMENIRAGNVKQMSIGFWVEEELADFDTREKPHFTITRAKLFDVSAVTFPAYKQTEIGFARYGEISENEIRSRLQPYEQLHARAEKARRERARKIASLL